MDEKYISVVSELESNFQENFCLSIVNVNSVSTTYVSDKNLPDATNACQSYDPRSRCFFVCNKIVNLLEQFSSANEPTCGSQFDLSVTFIPLCS
jgi:hypothetical protein